MQVSKSTKGFSTFSLSRNPHFLTHLTLSTMNRRSSYNNYNSNNNFRGYQRKKQRTQFQSAEEQLESKLGFSLFTEGGTRLGWLLTFSSSSCEDEDTGKSYSCVDLYFVTQDATYFKVKYKFRPYFYAATKDKMEMDVEAYLRRRYESQIANVEIVDKEDLDLKNHLSGLHKPYLKISFDTVQQLMEVRKDLMHIVERNQAKSDTTEAYEAILTGRREQRPQDFIECIIDLREYDVPYHVRFAIDTDVRCGQWYDVSVTSTGAVLEKRAKMLQRAEVYICAFDIETTKLPLKFPDPDYDMVMMISYMVDGKGYLIINRECVAEDIEDIEYTPKPEYEGFFQVTNANNEVELLKKWFAHMHKERPGIYVTYNGDFFDWPFLESRAAHHGFKMSDELGFQCDKNQGECRAKFACHLDCFAWVKRDSYLPQGSQGLKAVTKAKLGYDPLEVNPEDMVRFAKEKPQMMASYSVSDAVSTYYLYMTYVHPFIFSLATIIPMSPDEVLRKGSGTLCEMLLMVQAYKANVICPNKHLANPEKFHNSRLLDSETYIGGHVECLESGVFRSDLPTNFKLDKSAYQQLIKNLDRDLQYAIKVEGKMDIDLVSNYEEVKGTILEKLEKLQEDNIREECPLIYHLDVAAMYPNIILTNRLQPPSIVTDEICTACDFNRPGKTCLRKLEWVWRGEVFTASRSDYYHLKKQIESEFIGSGGQSSISFLDLPKGDQQLKLKERLKKYCQKAYKRVLDKPSTELREAGICMRENPFYVDTVRSFRDRRYEYKGEVKRWKGRLAEAKACGNPLKIQEAQDMVVLYDSLQLAHKCILNSFYGYVMRKGARWYSMEMAGVVTYTGAKIIQNARLLIEKIGKPLELDTDGIWCALPGSFPENFTFKTKESNKKLTMSYPCVMLNVDVAMNNTNDQYQTLTDPVNKTYSTHSECSIEFEVDGPYKAMILPASTKEGILLKKRYAVFNDDGTVAELKGFEIKRRGELKLIKVFQAEVFDKFLCGSTLEECYSAVASVANRWLDLLDNQGRDIADSELLDYITESNTMSKSLADYGEQKSCAVTTARRLADFLGDSMVKDKGLRCQYVIACEPQGTDVSQRAIPVAIFETDPEIMKHYVRKWCKMSSEVGIRSIIDWSYYRQRLSSSIQKIITIPAAMQKVTNPVPRVVHPDWLHKKIREKDDKFRQKKIVDMYGSLNKDNLRKEQNNSCTVDMSIGCEEIVALEDFGNNSKVHEGRKPIVSKYKSGHIDSQQKLSDHSESLHEDLSSTPDSIDRNTDYQGWLEIKKRKWKDLLNKRKKQRLADARTSKNIDDVMRVLECGTNRKSTSVGNGVGSYFKRPEVALTRCHWQIIQLVPNLNNGELLAWVLVEGFMIKVPITVPRVFYLNSKAPLTEEFPGRCVSKTLPHGKQSYSLIEVIIDEDQYRKESKKLAALLGDPEVEGIYETKVPLDFNAIVQIGCVCKVDKSASKRNVQDGWSLSELNMKTTTECSYLEQSISFFYLYHSFSEGRGIFVVYFPISKVISVVVLNPFQNKDLSPSFLERQYQEACQLYSIEPPPRNGFSFKVEYVGHVEDAHRILHKGIRKYRQQHCGATIVLIECPDAQLLEKKIRALDDFPCIQIPSYARDSHYQLLGWQQVAAKTGMRRCAASTQWLNEKIALCRYTHIPLGNCELDWRIFAVDVFFSRALRDHQQILWISDDGIPDLGGISEEDACFADEVHQSFLVNRGAYRRVTVELKVHNLAVNALLKSHQLDEFEGSSLLECGQSSEPYEFDEATSCQPAFRVLKQLIQRCLADAVTSGNVFADAILQHLYRWLCSPKSKLHDPALHRILHKVMKKVFALLLTEMRKLGSLIIFADFSKIILDTGKYHLSAARDYCDILLKTLQARDLFKWIELEPLHYWHSLLFMDQYNYGAIPAKPDELQADIVSSWNIAEYLPKSVQDQFVFIVSEFMYLPWKHAQKENSMSTSWPNSTLGTQSITVAAAEILDAKMSAYIKEQINSYFTEKLLGIVSDAIHLRGMNRSDHYKHVSAGPLNTSDRNQRGDAVLELIKYVCAVLELDQSVHHDVRLMKRVLLKRVRVGEFAPEAEFHDPCLSFTLPNVICSYCNECRDLDLCRDPGLLAQEWHCAIPQCGQPYEPEVMENALLQVVRQRERLYHLQDLVCDRSNHVKAVRLADQCECGGKYKCRESAAAFRDKIRILLNIADQQKFQLLKEYASWILEEN